MTARLSARRCTCRRRKPRERRTRSTAPATSICSGTTLYEILTGRPPRQGSSNGSCSIWPARAGRSPRGSSTREFHERWTLFCLKAISFYRRDRYATALALADDMQRFLSGEPTSAYRERWTERTARGLRRHRRGLARAAVVAALMVLAVVAGHHYRQARLLTVREQGRSAWNRFRHLFDEAQFTRPTPTRCRNASRSTIRAVPARSAVSRWTSLDAWGMKGQCMPLVESRKE